MRLIINDIELPVKTSNLVLQLGNNDLQSGWLVVANKTQNFDIEGGANLCAAAGLTSFERGRLAEVTGRLVMDNGLQLEGRVVVKRITHLADKVIVTVQMIFGHGNWTLPLTTAKLRELNAGISHVWGVEGSDVIYDIADRGLMQAPDRILKIDRYPAVRVATMLNAIFKGVGVRFQSNAFTTGELKDLFLLFTQPSTNDDFKYPRFRAQQGSDFHSDTIKSYSHSPTLLTLWGTNTGGTLYYGETIYDEGKVFNAGANSFVITDELSGAVVKLTAELNYYISSQPETYFCTSSGAPSVATVRLQIRKNGTPIAETTQTLTNNDWQVTKPISVATSYHRATKNDTYTVYMAVEAYVCNLSMPSYQVTLNLSDSVYWSVSHTWKADGETVTESDMLPDITQAEFVQQVMTTFDLIADYRAATRTLVIEPRRDLYKVARYMTLDFERQTAEPYQSEAARLVIEMSRDNEAYSEAAQPDKTTLDTNNGQCTGEKSVQVPAHQTITGNIYRQTIINNGYVTLSFTGEALYLAKSLPTSNNGVTSYSLPATGFGLRMAIYRGLRSVQPYKIENQTFTTYKYLQPLTSAQLANYYSALASVMRRSWVLTARARLPVEELYRLAMGMPGYSWATPVIIAGQCYQLKKLEVNPVTSEATIELITHPVAVQLYSGGTPQGAAAAASSTAVVVTGTNIALNLTELELIDEEA